MLAEVNSAVVLNAATGIHASANRDLYCRMCCALLAA